MAGVAVAEYPYYSPDTKSVDIAGMLAALDHDIVILQACAHNPTGVDLSKDQWVQVAGLVYLKKLFVVFDSAYQGFASGDVDGDAWAVRHFAATISTVLRRSMRVWECVLHSHFQRTSDCMVSVSVHCILLFLRICRRRARVVN